MQAVLEKEPHWLGLGLKEEMLDYESSLLKQEMLLKAEYQWKYETLGFLTVPEKTKFYSDVIFGSNWLLIKKRENLFKNVSLDILDHFNNLPLSYTSFEFPIRLFVQAGKCLPGNLFKNPF